MPRTKISEFSSTPASNTDIDSINIAEGCAPSGINDAIRELMAQLKDWQSGTSNDPMVIGSSGSLTLNQGTANGVAYLNGSKVVTSGSALTFDGTNLGVGTTSPAAKLGVAGNIFISGASSYIAFDATQSGSTPAFIQYASNSLVFGAGSSEQMRLTSTGLGIGTSSPSQKLTVAGTQRIQKDGAGYEAGMLSFSTLSETGAIYRIGMASGGSLAIGRSDSNTTNLTLDSSGNLGLGVTPSAWNSDYKALNYGSAGLLYGRVGSQEVAFGTNWYRNSGGSFLYSANGFASYQAQANGIHYWFTAPSGTAGNAITFTQAMTLTAGGNLFVGSTTAPTGFARVSLVGGEPSGTGANSGVQFTYNSSTYGGGAITTVNAAGGGMSFYTFTGNVGSESYTERARIDSSGNLLVGVTSGTSYRLALKTNSASQSAIGTSGTSGDTTYQAILVTKFDNDSTTSQNFIQFQINNGGANCGKITANGANTAAFGSTSDQRVKENIVELPSQLANIMALRPVEFDYNESYGGGHQIGFIAQEMQQVYPDVIAEDKSEEKILSITGWSKTEARLVKAIQEQQAIIESLKARLDAANL